MGSTAVGYEAPDPDLVADINGHRVMIEVRSIVRGAESDTLVRRARGLDHPLLVASERIAESARMAFKDAGVGFYDRRGRLRVVLPGVLVDTDVGPLPARPIVSAPLTGDVAKETAIALLSDPDARRGVREIGRFIGRAFARLKCHEMSIVKFCGVRIDG